MFSVRDFPVAVLVLAKVFKFGPDTSVFLSHCLLPVGYFLELGFFFLVGVFRFIGAWKSDVPITRNELTAWLMVLASFLVGTFLRSTTIGSNDLGWRCFLIAQLVLLFWGAVLVEDWRSRGRPVGSGFWVRLAQVCVVLGVIGTAYQLTMLRIYPLLHDYSKADPTLFDWVYPDQKVGERTYALRLGYERLNQVLPAHSIVQYNPYAISFISHELYSSHEAAVGSPDCGTAFGGNSNTCGVRFKRIMPLFINPTASQDGSLDDLCRQYGITGLLVDNTDEVWSHGGTWVWTRKPLFANEYVRAFTCGDAVRQADLRSGLQLR